VPPYQNRACDGVRKVLGAVPHPIVVSGSNPNRFSDCNKALAQELLRDVANDLVASDIAAKIYRDAISAIWNGIAAHPQRDRTQ
jgi:hypothetical protein